jgi:hypothetical protein
MYNANYRSSIYRADMYNANFYYPANWSSRLREVNYADNELLHYTHYGILPLPHSLVYSGQVDPAAPFVGSAIQAPQL